MHELLEKSVQCPYCGEFIDVLIDCSIEQQEYIEDCQVCCRPISFSVVVETDTEVSICVKHENE